MEEKILKYQEENEPRKQMNNCPRKKYKLM